MAYLRELTVDLREITPPVTPFKAWKQFVLHEARFGNLVGWSYFPRSRLWWKRDRRVIILRVYDCGATYA